MVKDFSNVNLDIFSLFIRVSFIRNFFNYLSSDFIYFYSPV